MFQLQVRRGDVTRQSLLWYMSALCNESAKNKKYKSCHMRNTFNMYVLAFIVTLLIIMSLPIIAWRPIILSFVLILLRHIIYLWLHIYILATILTLPHVLALAVLLWYLLLFIYWTKSKNQHFIWKVWPYKVIFWPGFKFHLVNKRLDVPGIIGQHLSMVCCH